VRREERPWHPLLAGAKPPYTDWQKVDCGRWLQGPLPERLPDGRLLVVGRSHREIGDDKCPEKVTRAFELEPETG
jgi:hypothetical protein